MIRPFCLVLLLLAASVVSAQPDPKRDEIVSKLHTMKVSLDFHDTPLSDVLDFLREMAGFNILLDQRALEEIPSEKRNVTIKVDDLELASALRLMLGMRDLTAVYRDGALVVVTKKSLQESVYTVLYDVRDLTQAITDFPGPEIRLGSGTPSGQQGTGPEIFIVERPSRQVVDPDRLVKMVQDSTGGSTWSDDKTGVQLQNGMLVVTQSREVHRQVEEFINRLRAAW